jgi:hypothetical protein
MLRNNLFALAFAAATLAVVPAANAQSTGDIAFTSFNSDEDGFSLVTFVDLAPGTTIFFRDDEWSGSSFNTGEGMHTWNSGASVISAGTVVRFSAVDSAARSASVGTISSTGDTGLSASNETIYAYLGSNVNTPTTFLAGISSEGSTNLTPAGLTNGSNAVVVTNSTDYAVYTGPRSGATAFADYRSQVNNSANWSILVGGSQEGQIPNVTPFTITAVPEAGALAQMLAGVTILGFAARRRRNS